jgi:hypothetical protein
VAILHAVSSFLFYPNVACFAFCTHYVLSAVNCPYVLSICVLQMTRLHCYDLANFRYVPPNPSLKIHESVSVQFCQAFVNLHSLNFEQSRNLKEQTSCMLLDSNIVLELAHLPLALC